MGDTTTEIATPRRKPLVAAVKSAVREQTKALRRKSPSLMVRFMAWAKKIYAGWSKGNSTGSLPVVPRSTRGPATKSRYVFAGIRDFFLMAMIVLLPERK